MTGVVAAHGDSGVRYPRFKTHHALLSFVFLKFNLFFIIDIFPNMSFSLSIGAVPVSVLQLEVGVKKNSPAWLRV